MFLFKWVAALLRIIVQRLFSLGVHISLYVDARYAVAIYLRTLSAAFLHCSSICFKYVCRLRSKRCSLMFKFVCVRNGGQSDADDVPKSVTHGWCMLLLFNCAWFVPVVLSVVLVPIVVRMGPR